MATTQFRCHCFVEWRREKSRWKAKKGEASLLEKKRDTGRRFFQAHMQVQRKSIHLPATAPRILSRCSLYELAIPSPLLRLFLPATPFFFLLRGGIGCESARRSECMLYLARRQVVRALAPNLRHAWMGCSCRASSRNRKPLLSRSVYWSLDR